MSIMGNFVGSYSQIGKTFIIEDESGNELAGVVTDKEQIFTATDNDVREGSVYASDTGVSTGTKVIPSYYTHAGWRLVTNGSSFVLPIVDYDYTKLQVIICPFNTSEENSISAEKVVINDNVYDVLSTEVLASVTKDETNTRVDFGITNNSGKSYLIRYFMYKEIY